MATKYWEPKAVAVAQVHTASIDSVDATPANNTFTVTIGGVAISQVGDTDVATTAAALVVSLEASTHPYFAAITWTNPSAGNIVGTADTAGVPFTAALTETGAGTGTVTDFAVTTACDGPNFVSSADNWDGEALPVNSDIIVFRDSAIHAAWGLGDLTTTGHTIRVEASYTGRIGLRRDSFATSADGQTVDTGAPEYREDYLTMDFSRIEIGGHDGIGDPGGSQRIKLDNDRAGASTTVIERTNTSGSELGKPPVRLLYANASADIDHRSGQIGIGVDVPGETATIGDVTALGGRVFIGPGVTWTNFTSHGGNHRVRAEVATVTKVLATGGSVQVDGDQAITTVQANQSGEVICNTTGTVTTATHDPDGGHIDYSRSGEARTVTTHQLFRGARVTANDDAVTITNFLEPDGRSTITVA